MQKCILITKVDTVQEICTNQIKTQLISNLGLGGNTFKPIHLTNMQHFTSINMWMQKVSQNMQKKKISGFIIEMFLNELNTLLTGF